MSNPNTNTRVQVAKLNKDTLEWITTLHCATLEDAAKEMEIDVDELAWALEENGQCETDMHYAEEI